MLHLQEPQSSEEKCQRKKECSSPRVLFTSLFLLYSGQKNFSISLSSNLNKVSLRELILTSKEHPFLQDGLHLHHCPSSLEFFLSTSSALCPSSKHVLVFPSLASPLRFCSLCDPNFFSISFLSCCLWSFCLTILLMFFLTTLLFPPPFLLSMGLFSLCLGAFLLHAFLISISSPVCPDTCEMEAHSHRAVSKYGRNQE